MSFSSSVSFRSSSLLLFMYIEEKKEERKYEIHGLRQCRRVIVTTPRGCSWWNSLEILRPSFPTPEGSERAQFDLRNRERRSRGFSLLFLHLKSFVSRHAYIRTVPFENAKKYETFSNIVTFLSWNFRVQLIFTIFKTPFPQTSRLIVMFLNE